MVEALFWPALLGYGEAALAYASVRTSKAATWGVRLGWLAQTALLAVQAARTDGFPWSSWAGSLNLFVWFVVGAYLIWGCRPRFRLLGLGVMPVAVALLRRLADRRGHGGGQQAALRQPLPRAPRRVRARGVRRLHARRGARGALPVGGAAAEAPRGRHPAPSPAAARVARAAVPAHDLGVAAAAHARARGRHRAAAAGGRRARCARRAGARHLARLRLVRRDAARRAAAPPTSRSAASRWSRLPGWRWRGATSHEALARRPVAPRRAGRAARAGDARHHRGCCAGPRGRRRRLSLDLQPDGAVPRGRRRRACRLDARGARRRLARRRALPPARRACRAAPVPGRGRASTRSSRGRGRFSARCAPRTSRLRQGRCSTGCSARRWPSASVCGPRPRSARARRRSARPRRHWRRRCSAISAAGG